MNYGLLFLLVLTGAFAVASAQLYSCNSRSVARGIVDGKLADCPQSPNCVCSQTPASSQQVEAFPAIGPDPIESFVLIILSMPRTRIITRSSTYLHAEFRSKWIGFIDDVELFYDRDQQQVHIRSASRCGYSDLGVNRARVNEIRRLYQA